MGTLWQALTAREKVAYRLHGIINRICCKTNWKYPRLTRLNDRVGKVWIEGYMRWYNKQRNE